MPKKPQSEIAGKATELIKIADKLVRDMQEDISKLLEALRKLKGEGANDEEKGK